MPASVRHTAACFCSVIKSPRTNMHYVTHEALRGLFIMWSDLIGCRSECVLCVSVCCQVMHACVWNMLLLFITLLTHTLRCRLLPWKRCCHGNVGWQFGVFSCARLKGPDPSLVSEKLRDRLDRERERDISTCWFGCLLKIKHGVKSQINKQIQNWSFAYLRAVVTH